jgi:hypothetical protein
MRYWIVSTAGDRVGAAAGVLTEESELQMAGARGNMPYFELAMKKGRLASSLKQLGPI